jgi:hypothetical protein
LAEIVITKGAVIADSYAEEKPASPIIHDFKYKFKDCTTCVRKTRTSETAEEVVEMVLTLEKLEDVRHLVNSV